MRKKILIAGQTEEKENGMGVTEVKTKGKK